MNKWRGGDLATSKAGLKGRNVITRAGASGASAGPGGQMTEDLKVVPKMVEG